MAAHHLYNFLFLSSNNILDSGNNKGNKNGKTELVNLTSKNTPRSFSAPLYILAFIIAIVIFGIGVYVGTLFDKSNLSRISSDVESTLQRLESAQILLFLDDSASFCPVYKTELEKLERDTELIGHRLNLLSDKGATDIELKKQYFVLEAQGYLLSKKVNERCNVNDTLVLYFYSNKNCEKCAAQGEDLLRSRDQLSNSIDKRIKFYSFDGDLGSAVADALKQKHYVYEYPTIVVNDKVYRDYQDVDTLVKIFSGQSAISSGPRTDG